jgi:hypothetical protein
MTMRPLILSATLVAFTASQSLALAGGFTICNDLAPGSRVCTSTDHDGFALENSHGRGSTVGTSTNGETWLRNRSHGLDVMTGDLPGFMSGEE